MKNRSPQGYTLLELIIYLALASLVMFALVSFMLSVFNARGESFSQQELSASARAGLKYISTEIRNSNGVNTGGSTFGSDPGVLELSSSDAGKNPIIINLTADDGQLQIKEGAGATEAIMPDTISVTNLVFTNLTGNGRTENIRVQMTVQYANPGSADYSGSQTYQTTVSVRQ